MGSFLFAVFLHVVSYSDSWLTFTQRLHLHASFSLPLFSLTPCRSATEQSRPQGCCTEWCSDSSLWQWETNDGNDCGLLCNTKRLRYKNTHVECGCHMCCHYHASFQSMCHVCELLCVCVCALGMSHQTTCYSFQKPNRRTVSEGGERTELRPHNDKLNMEPLQCLCLHSFFACIPVTLSTTTHTQTHTHTKHTGGRS